MFVSGGREEARREREVGDGETKRPDGGEEQEVERGRGRGGFRGVPP